MPLDLPYFPRPGHQLFWLPCGVCVYTLEAGGLERQVGIRKASGVAHISNHPRKEPFCCADHSHQSKKNCSIPHSGSSPRPLYPAISLPGHVFPPVPPFFPHSPSTSTLPLPVLHLIEDLQNPCSGGVDVAS